MATRPPKACRPCGTSCKPALIEEYGHADRKLFVTSGTSGGLVLCLMAMVNPGDEVIIFDPYFVMYTSLVGWSAGRPSSSTPIPISAWT